MGCITFLISGGTHNAGNCVSYYHSISLVTLALNIHIYMYTHILGKQSPGVGQCTQVSVFNILFYMYTYIMIKIFPVEVTFTRFLQIMFPPNKNNNYTLKA